MKYFDNVDKKDTQTLKSGNEVTVLSVATNKKFKTAQGKQKEVTTWHRVSCFGKIQEIANKYVQVGDVVFIRGEIQHSQIEKDEKAGQWSYSINAEDIRFVPKGGNSSNSSKTPQQKSSNTQFLDDNEIPF